MRPARPIRYARRSWCQAPERDAGRVPVRDEARVSARAGCSVHPAEQPVGPERLGQEHGLALRHRLGEPDPGRRVDRCRDGPDMCAARAAHASGRREDEAGRVRVAVEHEIAPAPLDDQIRLPGEERVPRRIGVVGNEHVRDAERRKARSKRVELCSAREQSGDGSVARVGVVGRSSALAHRARGEHGRSEERRRRVRDDPPVRERQSQVPVPGQEERVRGARLALEHRPRLGPRRGIGARRHRPPETAKLAVPVEKRQRDQRGGQAGCRPAAGLRPMLAKHRDRRCTEIRVAEYDAAQRPSQARGTSAPRRRARAGS